MPQPYKLFTIYAREDAQYLEELRGQLRPLEHAGRIKVWSDREINPGVDWEKEIVHNLDSADIILILVSAAYYNSAYIHEKEIKYALIRHEKGEAKVLPVIVRPCSFGDDPVISRLQVLPTDGKPVTDRRHWQDRDDAWLDVVAGVKRTLNLLDGAVSDKERAKEQEKQATLAAEAQREKEAQAQRERAERERLAQLRREQEQAERGAEQAAWQQAADEHNIPAYENYLVRYPQGGYAREARARIKELKRKNAAPLPVKRYVAIGGGALLLLLAVWLLPKMFQGGNSEAVTDSHRLTPADSIVANQQQPKDPDPSPGQITEGNNTISPSSRPENVAAAKPEKKENPTQQPPPVTRSRKSGLEMVAVQGGAFSMGSPASETGRDDNECPHPVTVRSFSIGKYEVTQADWRDIMGTNPSHFKNCDDCPVEQVSWNDIQDFLKKLNATLTGGQKPYRLPTEEEWEYAARGGSAANNTYFSYSGSNSLDAIAWYSGNSGSKTHPVGTKKANQLGLYDMSGNVWEWCSDTYKPYPCDNENTASGSLRVCRGGSWGREPRNCRSAYRARYGPAFRSDGFGFRLAASSF